MQEYKNSKKKNKTYRPETEKRYFNIRLKTIEGQIRGINKMIEEDKYCAEILTQLLAVDKSIKSLSYDLLKNHLNSCVIKDIKNNNTEVLDEVMDLIRRLN